MKDERTVDYRESLKNLPTLLEQRRALFVKHKDEQWVTDEAFHLEWMCDWTSNAVDIFASVRPLLCALMDHQMLWLLREDGTTLSLGRLRYLDGMIVFDRGSLSLELGPKEQEAPEEGLGVYDAVSDAATYKAASTAALTANYSDVTLRFLDDEKSAGDHEGEVGTQRQQSGTPTE